MDDKVKAWHEILYDLDRSHHLFANRILSTIKEYEKLYGVTVMRASYSVDDGVFKIIVWADGASWDIEVE